MAEGVAHAGGVGAVEQVCSWLDFFRARLDRAPQQGLVVTRKDVKTRGAPPKCPRLAIQPVVGIANHDHRAADRDFGMQNLAVGMGHPEQLRRAERPLVEGDTVGGRSFQAGAATPTRAMLVQL